MDKESLAAKIRGRMSLHRKRACSEIKELEEEMCSQSDEKSIRLEEIESTDRQDTVEDRGGPVARNLSNDLQPEGERKSGSVHSGTRTVLKNEFRMPGVSGASPVRKGSNPLPRGVYLNSERQSGVSGEGRWKSKSVFGTKKSTFSRKNIRGERPSLEESQNSSKKMDKSLSQSKAQLGSKIKEILEGRYRVRKHTSHEDNLVPRRALTTKGGVVRLSADLPKSPPDFKLRPPFHQSETKPSHLHSTDSIKSGALEQGSAEDPSRAEESRNGKGKSPFPRPFEGNSSRDQSPDRQVGYAFFRTDD